MRGPQGTRQKSGRNLGIRPAQCTTLSSTMERRKVVARLKTLKEARGKVIAWCEKFGLDYF